MKFNRTKKLILIIIIITILTQNQIETKKSLKRKSRTDLKQITAKGLATSLTTTSPFLPGMNKTGNKENDDYRDKARSFCVFYCIRDNSKSIKGCYRNDTKEI